MDDARKVKVEAYLNEVNAISEKYQLQIIAYVEFTSKGVIPRLTVKDILPKQTPPIVEAPKEVGEKKEVRNENGELIGVVENLGKANPEPEKVV